MNKKSIIWIFVFIVFLTVYLFFVTSFFQGIKNAKLYDDLPDLLIAFAGFLIIMRSFTITNTKSKKLLLAGGVGVVVSKLVEVPFQEYQTLHNTLIPYYLWLPVQLVTFLGILFLLLGFEEEYKNEH